MNVLIVSQYFWPETFRINDLAEGLMERGHSVTVLTGKPNYPGGALFPGYGLFRPVRQEYKGAKVIRVPLVTRGNGRGRRLALNYLSFAAFASLLGPVLLRGKVDVVFVFEPSPVTVGLPGIVMKRVKRAPLMFWVQDLWPESIAAASTMDSEKVLAWVGRVVRYIYRRSDKVLVQSRGFINSVEKWGARPDDVLYYPNWAEALYKPARPEEDAPERRELPDGFRVVFAGNIGAAQSFETILAAARKLQDRPEIHWVILGEGRQRKWVQEQIGKLGLEGRVHLLGRRPVEDMPRYFALADALLVSLKRDLIFSLTIPGKVQSYLACGRPVIAAIDGEGARVVEEAGCGNTAAAEDADALANAVLDMYEAEPEEREEMGRRARAYFEEHFEREKLFDRLEEWMDELIGGKR
ncbi:glycosyltransferase [Rubrobacter marinus]|uniref:Glycosyltransferase n=1 Tax=Rubrobacter marinus TaxID=2653852 RepID=A0A6G8PTP2_9ACTN|nr:glycosyltransferase family 4 protein [Rubrobacter marinus]QIN77704.1 glycosyltransferase [Rubrobacter marinus]